ncbi:MAG: hypothetical protein JAZ06_15480 [Candidatus Thiodiazotropha taylori]|nr:hypothetical protein [Candidatus Thiodiazotropha taylori]
MADSLSGEIEMVIHQGGRKYNPAVMMVITLSAVVVNNLTLYQVRAMARCLLNHCLLKLKK